MFSLTPLKPTTPLYSSAFGSNPAVSTTPVIPAGSTGVIPVIHKVAQEWSPPTLWKPPSFTVPPADMTTGGQVDQVDLLPQPTPDLTFRLGVEGNGIPEELPALKANLGAPWQ